MSDKNDNHNKTYKTSNRMEDDEINNRLSDSEFVTMVTRSTSPTPPASSSYVRNRRAEISIVHQKEVARSRKLPDTMDEETQCDRIEETSRFSRYGSGNRISGAPWSAYLDKYSSSGASSVGGSSMYSSRGFTNASSASDRFNSFAYARTNEVQTNTRNESTAKESSNSSQEAHSFNNRNQNEKASSDLKYTNSNENLTSNDSNESSNVQNIHGTNKEISESKIQEQCSCEGRKNETSGNPDSSRIFNQNDTFHRKDNSVEDIQKSNSGHEDWNNRQSSTPRYDECNQRKSSISRVGRSSPKSEVKISKCSSKTEIISPKRDAYCERRGSTPKSDASSSSKNEEPLRIVEGHCQNQNEEIISEKRNTLQKKDSTSRYVSLFCNKINFFIYV